MSTLLYAPISVKNIHTFIYIYINTHIHRHTDIYIYLFLVCCLDVVIMGKRMEVLCNCREYFIAFSSSLKVKTDWKGSKLCRFWPLMIIIIIPILHTWFSSLCRCMKVEERL